MGSIILVLEQMVYNFQSYKGSNICSTVTERVTNKNGECITSSWLKIMEVPLLCSSLRRGLC